MSYRMTHDDETIEAGIWCIAVEQIGKAINELNDDNLECHEAIHQIRKRFKKIRGLVRLARTSFEKTYQY